MTQVDFYILKNGDHAERLAFTCRLTEKVYRLGHKVHINAPADDVGPIDNLLWQQEPEKFLPHNIIGEGPKAAPPIQIGKPGDQSQHKDLLINLADNIPENAQNYRRIVEIVPPIEALRAISRVNFKNYRAQGFELKTHDINN